MTKYCLICGQKTETPGDLPKFCANCGNPFVSTASIVPKTIEQPQIIPKTIIPPRITPKVAPKPVAPIEDDEDSGINIDLINSMAGMELEEDPSQFVRKKITIGDLAKGEKVEPINSKPVKINKRKILEEIRSESGYGNQRKSIEIGGGGGKE